MSRTHPACREIEPDLVAVAAGEAAAKAASRVHAHVALCAPCRGELARYRAVEAMVGELRQAPSPAGDVTLARAELESRLADLRRRLIVFGVFSSPLGPILLARSELGVSMVTYLGRASAASRLAALSGVEAVEDARETEPLHRDLMDYLEGRRTRLDWPLDLRLARSEFQRRVLQVTAALPYGAVASYGGIARQIGAPTATRAVAQALRWNPVPIAIPCHRVIGSSGDLTGYAGNKVALKERLLALEGVRLRVGRGAHRVDRRTMYVRQWGDGEYCLPTCGSLHLKFLAELELFASRERAESTGLAPCTSCRPDLHPLPA
ncbi:MAG: methylated-DNA--[protein]-cysteine S-methyltransferase [Candidatus Rokubacteria bacterium]|nr:methylated-DNA--[protein]-cysteine S-methyltransferase [Candidatus Rokubacteria bacterium]